jgi:hypothetical protein
MDPMRRILSVFVPLMVVAGCADAAPRTNPEPSGRSPSASPASARVNTGSDVGLSRRNDATSYPW